MRWMLLLLLPLTACPSLGGETNCTTEARASVQLTVEDEAGSPIPDASLTWTEPDGVPTTCENMSAGEYVCGWEAAGELTIEVTATGFDTQQFGVTVGEDECHVITEMVTVTLVPSISPG